MTTDEQPPTVHLGEVHARDNVRVIDADHVQVQGDVITHVTPLAAPIIATNTGEPLRESPAVLLNARYRVVTFHRPSRATELTWLRAWCDSDHLIDAHLFTGPGGSGKTRLLIEWCNDLRSEGWQAGFLLPTPELETNAIHALMQEGAPVLIAIDYAETRQQLSATLETLLRAAQRARCKLRLVLLAREVADWWLILRQRSSLVGECLSEVQPARLTRVEVEGEQRFDLFNRALRCFANRLTLDVPSHDKPDLSHKRYGRPLYLHMLAMTILHEWQLVEGGLLPTILDHEQRFWTHTFKPQMTSGFEAAARRVVAALTLRGGSPDLADAQELAQRVNGPDESGFVPFLQSLYRGDSNPGERLYLTGLEPDLLGEALVTAVLKEADSSASATPDFLRRVFVEASTTQLTSGLTVLGRIALSQEEGARWCQHMLSEDILSRARPAFDAAQALGKDTAHAPLGLLLAEALDGCDDRNLAQEFEAIVPQHTVSLREVAAWATSVLLHHISSEETSEALEEQARLFNNLGNWLSELGKREEALKATQEAVEIRRGLAKARPDAFLPYLAGSLNNLGNRLSELGKREEALKVAQEAVELYQALFLRWPGAFVQNFLISLGTLAHCVEKAGGAPDSNPVLVSALEVLQEHLPSGA